MVSPLMPGSTIRTGLRGSINHCSAGAYGRLLRVTAAYVAMSSRRAAFAPLVKAAE